MLFRSSYVDWAAETGPLSTGAFHDMLPSEPGSPLAAGTVPVASHSTKQWCLAQQVCDAYGEMLDCIGGAVSEFQPTTTIRETGAIIGDLNRCARRFPPRLLAGWAHHYRANVLPVLSGAKPIVRRVTAIVGREILKNVIQRVATNNAIVGPLGNLAKAGRMVGDVSSGSSDGNRHLARDGSGSDRKSVV